VVLDILQRRVIRKVIQEGAHFIFG